MSYTCTKCNMKINDLTCGHCQSQLNHTEIKGSDGNDIQVSECPEGCGRIKSPTCCGQDMVFS